MENRILKHVYVSSTLTAAIWAAELALGEGKQRIYLVEATADIEDDPNVTDKKFPGNPTMSYRSTESFRIIAEVGQWQPHSEEEIKIMRDGLNKLKDQGHNLILD